MLPSPTTEPPTTAMAPNRLPKELRGFMLAYNFKNMPAVVCPCALRLPRWANVGGSSLKRTGRDKDSENVDCLTK